ncbi:MAG: GDCCVxC domain-containing (seleno)protein [Prolixibacteraceae bacterium]
MQNLILLNSKITCPECGFVKVETMPENACCFFYECVNCKKMLKPLPGDCCVFCSFGTVPCPPVQAGKNCCG